MAFSNTAAGNKVYGGGRPMPTVGPVDPMGYAERDLAAKTQRNAILRKLKAGQSQNYFSSAYMTPTQQRSS